MYRKKAPGLSKNIHARIVSHARCVATTGVKSAAVKKANVRSPQKKGAAKKVNNEKKSV
jgi:hypothetical protein